jgi:serine/threonine protein phosphatase PrpC/Leucine-rich repeat (LRR) protein
MAPHLRGAKAPKPALRSSERILDISNQRREEIPFKLKSSNLAELILFGNAIRKLPKTLPGLMHLDLVGNGLTTIPDGMARRIAGYRKLEVLELSFNGMTAWPKGFANLDFVRRLVAVGNKLSTFPINAKVLNELDLSQNRFSAIPSVPSSLKVLDLAFNTIRVLSFASDRLVRLYLSLNSMKAVDQIACPRLEVLDISRNHLDRLPDMSHLVSLRVLDCSDNFLTELPKLPISLREVSFRNNSFTSVPDLAEILPKISLLNFGENDISEFPLLAESVSAIYFDRSRLDRVPVMGAPNLRRLMVCNARLREMPSFQRNLVDEFYLADNLIQQIDLSVLSTAVTKIDLTHNRLTSIPSEVFRLPKLNTLLVAHNQITSITPEWSRSKTLVCVNVSWNPLRNLPATHPPFVKQFSCSYCELDEIPLAYSGLRVLTDFIAYGNALRTIPLFPACLSYYLGQNNFSKVPPLYDVISVLDLSCNRISKLPPQFNYAKLTDLDLSHNDLDGLPVEMNLPSLKFLKLAYNPQLADRVLPKRFERLQILNVEFTKIKYAEFPGTVRELMTTQEELFNQLSVKLISASPQVGFCEMNGVRDAMEDAIVVRENIRKEISAYGVFDGHSGVETATAAAYLWARACQEKAAAAATFITGALKSINETIQRENYPSGSTAVVALHHGRKIVFGHLGDARGVVLSTDGLIKCKTADHKPTIREEYERIRDEGSKVVAGRTAGVVAVTRAIGDFMIPGVGYEAEITTYMIDESDRWMVLACDGVWDVVNDERLSAVAKSSNNAQEFAYNLRNAAFSLGSTDNISVIVVEVRTAFEEEMATVVAPRSLPVFSTQDAETGRVLPWMKSARADSNKLSNPNSVSLSRGISIHYLIRDFYEDDEEWEDS